jgi:hypothetical protein
VESRRPPAGATPARKLVCSTRWQSKSVVSGNEKAQFSRDFPATSGAAPVPPEEVLGVTACSRQLTSLEVKIVYMERTSEQLRKWEPFPGLPPNLDTPSLTTDYHNGLDLILAEPRANGRAFRVKFEQPLAFRSVNESYRLKL